MAWAEKLATGWRGRYRDQHGIKQKVTQPDGSLFPRKRDAIEAAEEEAVKARRTAAVKQGKLPASVKWGDWWDAIAEDRKFEESDTASTERYIVDKWVRPKWGETPLNKITHDDVQEWVDDKEDGLGVRNGMSPRYARRVYAVLSVSMSTAVNKKVLDASPCVGIKLPKIPKKPKPYVQLEHAEKLNLREDYQDAVDFGLETGLRPGELCGLHDHRLDLENGWMEVVEAFVHRRRVIRPIPKDEDARMVPLSSKAIEIARRRLAGRDLTAGCGLPHTDGEDCKHALVFLTLRRRVMHPDAVGQCLRRAAEKAGVPRENAHMYALRRGFGTRAGRGGMDAFLLADLMGHADVRVTRGYVQMSEQARGQALAALGEQVPLKVVGQRGAAARGKRGADLDRSPLESDGEESAENTG
ncbi:tyrosine-type recombinase/integrase [Prauserella muralis]|uniref:Uncharacterized protein n=1 Tax=Prauserella muralis TaxID=588067 RepID=A0A2V4AMF3_9PSEU|nr:tyrosine-type recombinase/integrase [Prauserella muralis]PXY21164.1 hypothetical protein BAY60_27235 [Prauserella muralis]TWE30253.1 site-specific recombinase XerD [Prauserella muralis]